MTQTELNRAVSRATGEDCDIVILRGFSLVNDQSPLLQEDFEELALDWDKIASEQTTALFPNRQHASLC